MVGGINCPANARQQHSPIVIQAVERAGAY
jgi:hypothetical protein